MQRGVESFGFELDQEIVIGRLKGKWSKFSLGVRRQVLRLRARGVTLSRSGLGGMPRLMLAVAPLDG